MDPKDYMKALQTKKMLEVSGAMVTADDVCDVQRFRLSPPLAFLNFLWPEM